MKLKNTYFMQTNNEYQEGWPVRLIANGSWPWPMLRYQSEFRSQPLGGMVRHHQKLSDELDETGYQNRQRIFTSLQVELIFRYLGRP